MAKIVNVSGGLQNPPAESLGRGDRIARAMTWFQIPLVLASGIATFKGISDFFGITEHGINSSASWVSLIFAGFVVLVLTGAMWFSIEWVANRARPLFSRAVFFVLYFVLLIWSVGFGYGFWWSILSADDETNASVMAWTSEIKNNIADADGQLSSFISNLDAIRNEANRLKDLEQRLGGTCGKPPVGGCKDQCQARISVTDRLDAVSNTMKKEWLNKLKEDLGRFSKTVNDDIEKLNSRSETEKRRGLISIRDLGNTEQTKFNAFSRTQSRSMAADLTAISNELKIPVGQPNFRCFNPAQAEAINRFVATLSQPPLLKISEFKIYLGADSTKVAILRLWRWAAATLTGRELSFMQATGFETAGAATLRGNDWVALMATGLVDLAILFFSLMKPRTVFSSQREARQWLEENIPHGIQDFVEWYSKYHVDYWGTIYMVRPSPFWTRVSSRDSALSDDKIGMIVTPLIEKKLLAETKPEKKLLTLAQRVLQQKGWTAEPHDAPARTYKVTGNGLAQLFATASRMSGPRRPDNAPGPGRSTGDRRPGQ